MTKRPNLSTAVGRLRLCGIPEGISFLLLLGVAMPLKYAFGYPLAVRYVGMIHGILVLVYWLLILIAWLERRLSPAHAGLAFLASVVPFGPFLIDRKLEADERSEGEGG